VLKTYEHDEKLNFVRAVKKMMMQNFITIQHAIRDCNGCTHIRMSTLSEARTCSLLKNLYNIANKHSSLMIFSKLSDLLEAETLNELKFMLMHKFIVCINEIEQNRKNACSLAILKLKSYKNIECM